VEQSIGIHRTTEGDGLSLETGCLMLVEDPDFGGDAGCTLILVARYWLLVTGYSLLDACRRSRFQAGMLDPGYW